MRRSARLLAGLAGVVALVLATGVLSEDVATWVSNTMLPFVAIGAGVVLVVGGSFRAAHSRMAWSLFGVGAILLGLGDFAWAWYEVVVGVEPPFPGLPDVFYLASYVALAAGVFTLPHFASNHFQMGQQVIDAVVIISGVAIVAWMTVLGPMYQASGEVTTAELLVGAAYPIGDAFIIAIVGVVGLRRSLGARDWSLWCVMAALLVTAVGDVIYLTQSWSGSYLSGSWVDSTWVAGYGLFALAASWLPDRVEPRTTREGRLPLTYVFIPVGVIVGITVLHLARKASMGSFEDILFETVLATLGLLVLGRILLAVGEDRSLVEAERKRLISVVSHELRTPLTAVDGYIGLVLDDWHNLDESDKLEMLAVAQDQARLVTRIVTDLVETSRDSLHAAELKLELVDFNQLVEEVVEHLDTACRIRVDGGPPAMTRADRGRLIQIVTNLVENALRYGGGDLRCATRTVDGEVELTVHDSGSGVPARFRESIWSAFERGVHRFDAATPGSGLGLAIVRSLVRAHGGRVGYRTSELLGGACFWIRIPLAGRPVDASPPGPKPEANGSADPRRPLEHVLEVSVPAEPDLATSVSTFP